MNDEQLRGLADLQAFLNSTVALDFTIADVILLAQTDIYEFLPMQGRESNRG